MVISMSAPAIALMGLSTPISMEETLGPTLTGTSIIL